jgi:hypothetical protein
MSDFSQVRSFNLGIAQETSVEAALIYDDLAYAQYTVSKDQWFYRSYEKLLQRLPVMSERTMRNAINQLEAGGWITKKKMKIDGAPVCHYKICRFLSAKSAETMESAKSADSIYKTTKETTKSNAQVNSLLSQLLALVNPREKATADRRRALAARLKDYTEEEILASARVFSKSEWHIENKQMSVDNLLAPSKFGRWYAQRETADAQEHIKTQDERVRERMGGSDATN